MVNSRDAYNEMVKNEPKMEKEILHKKGCYNMIYENNLRCIKCKVKFKKIRWGIIYGKRI